MTNYRPFKKEIERLCWKDLLELHEVSEGWYVEYKKEVPEAKSITKSVSSFANQYGGWLFYGIAETLDGSNRAGEIIGIQKDAMTAAMKRVRDAINRGISPVPFYKVKVVYNNQKNLGVIVVQVTLGMNAPFIHQSGRIYFRKGDSSEPIEANTRLDLEELLKRQERAKKSLRDFVKQDLSLMQSESAPLLMLKIKPDFRYWNMIERKIKFNEYCSIMRGKTDAYFDIPFDNNYSGPRCFVSRQVQTNNPLENVLTLFYYYDCSASITIPLNVLNIANLDDRFSFSRPILEMIYEKKLRSINLIDLNSLFTLIYAIILKYFALIKYERQELDFLCKMAAYNMSNKMCFLDDKAFVDNISKNGLPIIHQSNFLIPEGDEIEDYISIKNKDPRGTAPKDIRRTIGNVMAITAPLLSYLGIPAEIQADMDFGRYFVPKQNKKGA